jgi:hypothetical protein
VSTTHLPIVCAWCERVRTSAGRWEEPEATEGDDAEATHGICPDCLAAEQRAARVATGRGPLIQAGARPLPQAR